MPGLLSPWLAVEREAPHELARLNMISGLAWAMTIVNVRQPAIMENFLKYQINQVAPTPAFSNGVMSTLVMGMDITPNDVYITRFLKSRPDSTEPQVVELWDKLVARPANDAVRRIHPALKKYRRLGALFRYQDLSELVARLEGVGR